jgi:hypothetical protein
MKVKKSEGKLNPKWIVECRKEFKEFLDSTGFPHPERNGARGSSFEYPEWMIMFIAVLSVKSKVKTYLGIHRMVEQYWRYICPSKQVTPISETQLRERLKKIRHTPREPAKFIFQIFPEESLN